MTKSYGRKLRGYFKAAEYSSSRQGHDDSQQADHGLRRVGAVESTLQPFTRTPEISLNVPASTNPSVASHVVANRAHEDAKNAACGSDPARSD